MWSFFNIIYSFLGSMFEPCYIQNRVITNHVIKRLKCRNFNITLAYNFLKFWTTGPCTFFPTVHSSVLMRSGFNWTDALSGYRTCLLLSWEKGFITDEWQILMHSYLRSPLLPAFRVDGYCSIQETLFVSVLVQQTVLLDWLQSPVTKYFFS